MKPPKPRIVKPRLVWKWNKYRKVWQPFHRVTWSDSGKRKERAILLDWKADPAELDRLYWEAQTGRHERQAPTPKYTWRECIEMWRSDPKVQGKLAAGTKRSYRLPMDRIMAKNGGKDMRKTTRGAVRKAHDSLSDTPRKADRYLQTISLLWNYAKNKRDWPLGDNPAAKMDHFGAKRQFEPWPEWMVGNLATAPETVRTAAELILGTGQRPSAAIGMRRDQFAGEWMTVLDEKQDEWLDVYCPQALREYVEGLPVRGAHVIARNLTEPLGYDAVEKAFRRWREGLGERAAPYSLHGLRKLAIIRLAEAGASDAEIQAVTNQSAETVAFYRKRASRKKLSRAAQERRK